MSNTPHLRNSKGTGFIRWSGFVPFVVLSGLFLIYFKFFFDAHLKHWISKFASTMNGAQVDIGELRTKLLDCTFEIKRLDISNPDEPMKNRASIDRIFYSLLFRPLLQKKFVINEASITGIQWGTDRAVSGALPTPPEKPASTGMLSTMADNIESEFKRQADAVNVSQFSGLFSGNIQAKIEDLGAESFSFKKHKELNAQLDVSEKHWKNLLEAFPNQKTVTQFKNEADQLSSERPSNPQQGAGLISRADNLKKSIESTLTHMSSSRDQLSGEIQKTSNAFSGFENSIEQDIAEVRKKIKVPSVDLKDITPGLLGPRLASWLSQTIYWANLSRRYLPQSAQKTNRVEVIKFKGIDVHFAPVNSYPGFLLKRGVIESNVASNSRAGNVSGTLLGLNSNPPTYGHPTDFQLKGEFPAARISGADISIHIDHVTEKALESAEIKLGAFPLEKVTLTSDPSLSLAIENASGKADISIKLTEGNIDAHLNAVVAGVRYRVSATRPELEGILKTVTGQLAAFELHAKIKGSFDSPHVSITSDLGEKMAKAITSVYQKQIQEINNRIKNTVESQIAVKKNELNRRIDKSKQDILQPMEDRITLAKQAMQVAQSSKNRFESEKNQFLKRAEDEAKSKSQDALKGRTNDLKKSLGF